jgi:hypothetical protein
MIKVEHAVVELIHQAKESQISEDALKFSQAACNVANARASMLVKPPINTSQGVERTLLLTKYHSFDADSYRGERLFCALVPIDRKSEFLKSSLRSHLRMCTDRIFFYTEDNE